MIIGYENSFERINEFYMNSVNGRELNNQQKSTTVSTVNSNYDEQYVHRDNQNRICNYNELFQGHFLFVRKDKPNLNNKQISRKKNCSIQVYYSSDEEDEISSLMSIDSENIYNSNYSYTII